jgi:regulator of sirC expression with transglutaminase-like and TPR domain
MSTFLGFQVRARAEIKEEQMRQEIIATTGQMHAMRDNFVTRIDDTSKEVEDRTEELTAKIAELEKLAEEQTSDLSDKTEEITVLQGMFYMKWRAARSVLRPFRPSFGSENLVSSFSCLLEPL